MGINIHLSRTNMSNWAENLMEGNDRFSPTEKDLRLLQEKIKLNGWIIIEGEEKEKYEIYISFFSDG